MANTSPQDGFDVDGYVAKHAECVTCGGVIVQWRNSPNAGYRHEDSGYFACPPEFQIKTFQATPKPGTIR